LNFSLTLNHDHIQLEWKGYSATMDSFVQQVLDRLLTLKGQDLELEFN